MDRIAALRDEGRTTAQIADILNREGFSPPKRRRGFFPDLVRQLMVRRGLARSEAHTEQLGPHEWWLPRLAEAIPITVGKLANWARRGRVRSRRTLEQHFWILWADESELGRLRELAAASHRGVVKYPAELTSPKRLGHD